MFPKKIIREVTGHRSTAVLTYERPSLQQRQAVSSVLMSGENKQDEASALPTYERPSLQQRQAVSSILMSGENKQDKASVPVGKVLSRPQKSCVSKSSVFGSMFAGLEHCTININPRNLIINMNGPQQRFDEEEDCEEFDGIISAADFDI